MGVGSRVQPHKYKLKKETNDDYFRHLKKSGTPECHMSMTSHFNVIKKCGQKVSNQDEVYHDKQIDSVKNPYNKIRRNSNS